MLFWILKAIFYIPVRILYPISIIGKKNIPKSGGAIEICNHRRLMDIVVTVANQMRKPRTLGKKELFKFFLFRWLLKALGGMPVDRQDVKASSLKTVIRVLKKGKIVLIFPEGTRNKNPDGKLMELKQGTALLALMARVPVIPMYLKKPPKLFRKNCLFIGEAVDLSNYYNKVPTPQILEEANQALTDSMLKLQEYSISYKNKYARIG